MIVALKVSDPRAPDRAPVADLGLPSVYKCRCGNLSLAAWPDPVYGEVVSIVCPLCHDQFHKEDGKA